MALAIVSGFAMGLKTATRLILGFVTRSNGRSTKKHAATMQKDQPFLLVLPRLGCFVGGRNDGSTQGSPLHIIRRSEEVKDE